MAFQVPDLTPYVADVHAAVNALTEATSGNPDAAVGAIQPIVDLVSAAWASLKAVMAISQ